MPPNRKTNVDVVDNTLINVNDLRPKFLPLTHPECNETAQQQKQTVQQDEKLQHQEPSHDAYWEWPADQDQKKDMINRILEEERIRNMLSAEHVQEKIAREQQHQVDSSSSDDNIRSQKVDEDYWKWPAEEAVVVRHASRDPAHPSQKYWDWPTHTKEEEKKLLIQNILEEDRCHRLLSVEHVEKNLQQHVAACLTSPTSTINAANDDYWTWNS